MLRRKKIISGKKNALLEKIWCTTKASWKSVSNKWLAHPIHSTFSSAIRIGGENVRQKWTVTTRDAHTIPELYVRSVSTTSILSLFRVVERAINRFHCAWVCFSFSNMKSGFSLLIKFQECFECVSKTFLWLGIRVILACCSKFLSKRKQNTH